MSAKVGTNGDPIATPSTYIKYLLLNVKIDSLVAMINKLRKSSFGMLGGFLLSLYNLSTQISMVSSRGKFVNKELTSRLAMCTMESC